MFSFSKRCLPLFSVFCLSITLTFLGQAKGAVILVDFGTTSTSGEAQTWNNITAPSNGSISNLRDSTNATTGFSIAVTSAFEASTGGGQIGTGLFPDSATVDTFYSSSSFSSSQVVLSNLNPNLRYDLTFFASLIRDLPDTATRRTRYTVTGNSAAQSVELTPLNNISDVAALSAIIPNANNQIIIDISRGTGNTSSTYLLGLIRIETHAVPEPSRVLLFGLGAVALLGQRRRASGNV